MAGGLFAQHVAAVGQGVADDLLVEAVGHAHADDVRLLPAEHLDAVRVEAGYAEAGGHALRQGRVDIAHRRKLHPLLGEPEIGDVGVDRLVAGPDDAQLHLLHGIASDHRASKGSKWPNVGFGPAAGAAQRTAFLMTRRTFSSW